MRPLALALSLVLGAGWVAVSPARAAEFAVNSSADQPDAALDGTCDTAGPGLVCTLRAAVQESNRLADADLITLPDLGSEYDLSLSWRGRAGRRQRRPRPDADGDAAGIRTTRDRRPRGRPGPARGPERRADGQPQRRRAPQRRRPWTPGAGILVEAGALNLSSVTIAGSTAENPGGAAAGGGVLIDSPGPHSIVASTVSGNTAQGQSDATGGGIDLEAGAVASFTNATISGNTAAADTDDARGGGIASAGSPTLTHTTVHANTATAGDQALGGSLLSSAGATQLRATIVSAGGRGRGRPELLLARRRARQPGLQPRGAERLLGCPVRHLGRAPGSLCRRRFPGRARGSRWPHADPRPAQHQRRPGRGPDLLSADERPAGRAPAERSRLRDRQLRAAGAGASGRRLLRGDARRSSAPPGPTPSSARPAPT